MLVSGTEQKKLEYLYVDTNRGSQGICVFMASPMELEEQSCLKFPLLPTACHEGHTPGEKEHREWGWEQHRGNVISVKLRAT